MKLYKVEILPKTKDFDSELIEFLFEKSPLLKREFSIQNILNEKSFIENFNTFLENKKEYEIDDVYGSTFQTYWRNNKDIYAISHSVKKICKIDDKFYGFVKASDYGEIIDFEKGVLRPVYYKPKENFNEYKIATFDIDFTIT